MIYNNIIGGDEGNRTPGLLVANETLSRTELRPHLIIYINNSPGYSRSPTEYGNIQPLL